VSRSQVPSAAATDAPPTHWASLPEHTFVLGIRFLYWVYRVFGRLPLRICLYPVVTYYWLSGKMARQSSMQYLQRMQTARNALEHVPTWRDSLRHFLNFADTILDKLLALNGSLSSDDVRITGSGEAQLQAVLAQGRGAMVVTGHVGCMELCRISGERHRGVRLNVLVHTRHAERFTRMLHQINPASEVHFIQVTEVTPATAMLLADRIARGEILAMAGDRIPVRIDGAAGSAAGTVQADFLGHAAHWPIGPYVLASLFKCPLFAVVCVKESAGYVMHVERMAESVILPRRQRPQALAQYAQQFADWLTPILAASPLAWFNFFPFWQQGTHSASRQPHEPHNPS
jgi:predicted LPLAT superfamily acyltransferase